MGRLVERVKRAEEAVRKANPVPLKVVLADEHEEAPADADFVIRLVGVAPRFGADGKMIKCEAGG